MLFKECGHYGGECPCLSCNKGCSCNETAPAGYDVDTDKLCEKAKAYCESGRGADCKWCKDEVCVNADCPLCADFCPVVDAPDVCRFEDRGNGVRVHLGQSSCKGVLMIGTERIDVGLWSVEPQNVDGRLKRKFTLVEM